MNNKNQNRNWFISKSFWKQVIVLAEEKNFKWFTSIFDSHEHVDLRFWNVINKIGSFWFRFLVLRSKFLYGSIWCIRFISVFHTNISNWSFSFVTYKGASSIPMHHLTIHFISLSYWVEYTRCMYFANYIVCTLHWQNFIIISIRFRDLKWAFDPMLIKYNGCLECKYFTRGALKWLILRLGVIFAFKYYDKDPGFFLLLCLVHIYLTVSYPLLTS